MVYFLYRFYASAVSHRPAGVVVCSLSSANMPALIFSAGGGKTKKGRKHRSDTAMPSENRKLPVTFQSNSSVSKKQPEYFCFTSLLFFVLCFPSFSPNDKEK